MRNTKFSAVLVDGKSTDRTALVQYVKTEIIRESRRLKLTLSLPEDGEFGLQIESTETRTRVVCNYLLSTSAQRTEKANVKLARKKMRDDVKKLEEEKPENWKKQIASCDASIEKCRKQGLHPSDEDLCMEETLTELYRYKNALRDGKNRRNIRVLTAVLSLVKRYKNEMAIAEEVEKTENFMKRLLSLMELSKEASRLGDAFSYLDSDASYPDVESVYRAVLLLLKYSATEIKTMGQIQSKLHNAEGAVQRLTEIHKAEIFEVHRTHARREIDKVDGESIRVNHEHVYGLYKWVQKVLDVYDRKAEGGDGLEKSSDDAMERANEA